MMAKWRTGDYERDFDAIINRLDDAQYVGHRFGPPNSSIRLNDTPVVMLTARGEERSSAGFGKRADDYSLTASHPKSLLPAFAHFFDGHVGYDI